MMNWFQFTRLIHSIYRNNKKLPDLDWIQQQGLLAVKIGQIHALRIDFLDKDKCIHLAKLYRQAYSLPPQSFNALLSTYTPDNYRANFETIDDIPLASASVGQVHLAKLKSGAPVVLKILKKDVRKQFIEDVKKVRNLFRLITFIYPKLKQVGDPVGILDDIEKYTLSELDLRHEVAGQTILRDIHKNNCDRFDLSKLRFVHVYDSLSNENVMVSEFVEGKTFDELLENNLLRYEELLELFHVHGFYLFVAGIFHGDIHPGNVILHDGYLYFIDTGYIGRVGDKIRKGLFQFFNSLCEYHYQDCAMALNSMSEQKIEGHDYSVFQDKFIDLYSDFTDKTVSQVSLTKKMMETIKLGVNSGMVFDKGIFAIIRSLMYLDGMVLRCKPDAILLKDMRAFINEFKSLV